MISLDIHNVRKISAHPNLSNSGKYSWLKLTFEGPTELFELTLFCPDPATAEIYASAIRGVKIEHAQEAA